MSLSRQERINLYGSPNFKYTPSISANGIYTFAPADNSPESKYKPFDSVTIQNDSNSDITLFLNGDKDRAFPVQSGTSRELETPRINFFSHFRIEEDSGSSISSGDLTIEVSRKGMDSDKRARQQASRPMLRKVLEHFTGV